MNVEYWDSGESDYFTELPAKSIRYLKSAVAFANGRGGRIVFGMEDETQDVAGMPKEHIFKTMDIIRDAITESCEPAVVPELYLLEIDGKTVLVAEIEAGRQRPYYIKSLGVKEGTFVRSSGGNKRAEGYKLRELVLEGKNESFDLLPVLGVQMEEDELAALCQDMTLYAEERCGEESAVGAVRPLMVDQLFRWGLLIDHGEWLVPSYGLCLLAGKKLPAVRSGILCESFRGTGREEPAEREFFEGPLYRQLDAACEFVLHVMRGEDKGALPVTAIRAAIVFAVCHRSYLEPDDVRVALFADRLEVAAPGLLVSGMSLEKMRRGYLKIRNRGIAAAFAYMGILKGWGSSIPMIVAECREQGGREPELAERDDDLVITMFRTLCGEGRPDRPCVSDEKLEELPDTGEETSGEKREEELPDTGEETSGEKREEELPGTGEETSGEKNGESLLDTREGTSGEKREEEEGAHERNRSKGKRAVRGRRNDTQVKILALLKQDRELSAAGLSERIGISQRNIEVNIGKLKACGRLIRHGSPKKGYWEVIADSLNGNVT